ncbi:Uncharacterised protein [Mycobacteroides abscessus subsp. abscessus]|nr:Uncharacterised protein [Mycobacteroides abscessus subsp. abscessus]
MTRSPATTSATRATVSGSTVATAASSSDTSVAVRSTSCAVSFQVRRICSASSAPSRSMSPTGTDWSATTVSSTRRNRSTKPRTVDSSNRSVA